MELLIEGKIVKQQLLTELNQRGKRDYRNGCRINPNRQKIESQWQSKREAIEKIESWH
jgi:hypothetical protein